MPNSPHKSPSSLSPISSRFAAEAARENLRRLRHECEFLSAALASLKKGSKEWELIKSKLDIASGELACEIEDSKIVRYFACDDVGTDGEHDAGSNDDEAPINLSTSTPPLQGQFDKGSKMMNDIQNLSVSLTSIPTLPLVELSLLNSGVCRGCADSGQTHHKNENYMPAIDLSSSAKLNNLQQRGDGSYSNQNIVNDAAPRKESIVNSREHPNIQATTPSQGGADKFDTVQPNERGFEKDQLNATDLSSEPIEVQKYSMEWFRIKRAMTLDVEWRQRDVNKSMNVNSSESNSFAHSPLEQIGQTQLEHDMQQSQQNTSLKGERSLPMQDARNKTDVAPLEKYSLEWFTSKLDGNAPRNTEARSMIRQRQQHHT
jgi:hypothetical protein